MIRKRFYEEWQPVIGLEIHAQLKTDTKLFARSRNRFGDEPNTNIDMIDTGQPGALPVLNKKAVALAVLFGCAIGAEIAPVTSFDRKSYFYPDSPRNFQITQFSHPVLTGGTVVADVEGKSKTFTIKQAHLEDDAGMLKHFSRFAGVDYNRAGVPLLEIVSLPCMFSPKEAVAYAMSVKAILEYLNVSDCNMEEGSLRIDTNISIRPRGETTLRNKVEIKNMNSFTNMEAAIEAELHRQERIYAEHPDEDPCTILPSETVRFDLEKKEIVSMRSKERDKDYRYFPEPDLPPLILSEEYIDSIRKTVPELPHEKFFRYTTTLGLSEYNASVLVNNKTLSDYFEKALTFCKNPRLLCNWVTIEFVGRLKEKGLSPCTSHIVPEQVALLVNAIEENRITGRIAKEIADIMVATDGKTLSHILEENPHFQAMHDTSDIEPIVDQVLGEHTTSVEAYLAGKEKAFNFLVGQVMKLSKGKASPEVVKNLLLDKLR